MAARLQGTEASNSTEGRLSTPSVATEATRVAAGYPPIGDYAIIGDCRTAALISREGSLDWLCLPHFSGRAVFAAILDCHRGGRFMIHPAGHAAVTRQYLGASNVLRTIFKTDTGSVQITDLLPVLTGTQMGDLLQPQREILRVIECCEGEVEIEVLFEPRPDFARVAPRIIQRGSLGWVCEYSDEIFVLRTDLPLSLIGDGLSAYCRSRLRAHDKRYLSLAYVKGDIGIIAPIGQEADTRLSATLRWWETWSRQCTYKGSYHEMVLRSALTLKLLTYALSGAVLAAPTASLPEEIGGSRNWDYRYCWLRDASHTLRSFIDLGYRTEGEAFLGWMLHATRLTWPRLQVLYDVYGEAVLPEVELHNLDGYRGSRPVRIGNKAWTQLQLDIYGAVVLAAYDFVQRWGQLDLYETRMLIGLGRTVCNEWRMPDQGIWEIRGEHRHYTYSKLMCWVALDRLVKLYEGGHLPRAPADLFRRERDAIRDAIEHRAFNRELGIYVGAFDGKDPDASLLLMARNGYIDARDPRMIATYESIRRELSHNGLLLRYPSGYDNEPGTEGAFGICSFWEVDYLARLGNIAEAEKRFEHLLSFANDLGLYAEEIDINSGAALGNFPQAYTHVGLISAALSITEARTQGRTTS